MKIVGLESPDSADPSSQTCGYTRKVDTEKE